MALKPIVGEIKSQDLNDNFSYLDEKIVEGAQDPRVDDLIADLNAHKAEKATATKLGHVYGFRGVALRLLNDQSIANEIANYVVWESTIYDTDGFWDSDNPTRLTIPQGISRVKLYANIEWSSNNVGRRSIVMRVNRTGRIGLGGITSMAVEGTVTRQSLISSVMDVNAGDYFEIEVSQTSGSSLNIQRYSWTWFALEVVE